MSAPAPHTIITGLAFGEGPRWHDGALWFSDMHGHRVVRPRSTATPTPSPRSSRRRAVRPRLAARRPAARGGDGDPAAAADRAPTVRSSVHADLSPAGAWLDQRHDRRRRRHRLRRRHGRAHPRVEGSERVPGQTIRVAPDGAVSCAADDLASPNGHILTDDGRTLIVAESGGGRLTAFTVQADGTLTDRRTYAELTPEKDGVLFAPPDGICLDAEGAVWVADPHRRAGVPRARGRRGHRLDRLQRRDPGRVRPRRRTTVARCSCASPPTGSATSSTASRDRPHRRRDVDVPGAGRP